VSPPAPKDEGSNQQERPARNAERGQRTHDRSRDAAARIQEPPQSWLDDSEAAIRDLVEGPGR
jgi:hypothetical protein